MLEHAVVAEGGGEGATRQEGGGRAEVENQPSLQNKVRKEGQTELSRVGAQKRPKGSSLLLGVIIASPWGVLYVCKLNLCR